MSIQFMPRICEMTKSLPKQVRQRTTVPGGEISTGWFRLTASLYLIIRGSRRLPSGEEGAGAASAVG